MSVIGQECFDASLWDQLATQCCRIEQLRVGFALSLHLPILDDPDSYQVGFFQQASRPENRRMKSKCWRLEA